MDAAPNTRGRHALRWVQDTMSTEEETPAWFVVLLVVGVFLGLAFVVLYALPFLIWRFT